MAEVQEDVLSHLKNARIKDWRAYRVVGRLHNVILYIGAFTQYRNMFIEELKVDIRKLLALIVYLDNDTHWSSTYDMIQSAVKNRAQLMWYMQQTPELQDDALTEEGWEDLEEMLKLLKPFKKFDSRRDRPRFTIIYLILKPEFHPQFKTTNLCKYLLNFLVNIFASLPWTRCPCTIRMNKNVQLTIQFEFLKQMKPY